MKRLPYDTTIFPFKKVVEDYLKHTNLPLIHEEHPFEETLVHGTDQAQPLHRTFYDTMDADNNQTLANLYRRFIKEVISPCYDYPIIFQRFPTFRIHQPSNIAVFGWHRDRDYNHNPQEINYYLPITSAFDTNTFWYESEPNKEDYQPMEGEYGEVIEWDGPNCRHGNKPNDTGKTRVSFDFRVLSRKVYDSSKPKQSITQGTSFKIGDYFDTLE
tara:strand:+ start:343 stop:987 length:645 start_codon:yes stop_codon:yes gene_type:complete